jgi:hypothetical protein
VEYVELALCRMYHCTPSALYEQDYQKVMTHLALQNAETEVKNLRAKANAAKAKARRNRKFKK